jgi:hypothetical protein
VRHRLFYLPAAEAIIMPQARQAGGWRCAVVACRRIRRPGDGFSYLDLTDEEIATVPTALRVDPDRDPEGYAMLLWVTRVHQHDPCGVLPYLARRVATDLRVPGSLTADFAHASVKWLRSGAHPITALTLKLHIDRLVAAGFLAPDELPGNDKGLGAYTLTLPEPVASIDEGQTR